jgi:hypothetical protein
MRGEHLRLHPRPAPRCDRILSVAVERASLGAGNLSRQTNPIAGSTQRPVESLDR